MRLTQPKLDCPSCIALARETGRKTLCENGKRRDLCEIGDVAPDFEYSRFINQYLTAKKLGGFGNDKAEQAILERLGLYDDLTLLDALESIWHEWLSFERKKHRALERAKKL